MEDVMRRSGPEGFEVFKEEKKVDSNGGESDCKEEVVAKVGTACHDNNNLKSSSTEHTDSNLTKQVVVATKEERSVMDPDSIAPSSSQKEQDAQLESARAEMGEVIEENQRLKVYLGQMMKDYRNLQMQLHDITQQEETKKVSTETVDNHQQIEEPELVSLTLGRFSSEPRKDAKNKSSSQGKDEEQVKQGLSLGLECKFQASKSDANKCSPNPSPVNSFEERKEESGEAWLPGKALKTMRNGDDEVLEQNPVKKARVSVRARCDTPTMNDGCQWRKYGQKIAKGNPCPRAYYRCTVGPSCPVRKQVQRCVDDMSILVTTYEGTHNHPLPVSATAMASTTSAAASMLLSGSSSSSQMGLNPSATTINTAVNLHGLNFYLPDDLKSKQFYLHNPSLSSAPSHPTITLDLTSTPSSSSHFNRFSPSYPSIPKFTSTSLNFSSSESNAMHVTWGNMFSNHGSTSQPYNRNQLGTANHGRPPTDTSIYQSYMQKNNLAPPPQSVLPNTIAAATKAITTDPSFQSVLAAALTSIIGTGSGSSAGGSTGASANPVGGDNFAQKLRWGEHFPVASGCSSTPKGNACATSYLNKTTSTNSQPGCLMFLPPSLPFSSPSSASASPGDSRDHKK